MHNIHRSDDFCVFCLRFSVATFTTTPAQLLLRKVYQLCVMKCLETFAKFRSTLLRNSSAFTTPWNTCHWRLKCSSFWFISSTADISSSTKIFAVETPKKSSTNSNTSELVLFFFCGRLRNSNWRHPSRASFSVREFSRHGFTTVTWHCVVLLHREAGLQSCLRFGRWFFAWSIVETRCKRELFVFNGILLIEFKEF